MANDEYDVSILDYFPLSRANLGFSFSSKVTLSPAVVASPPLRHFVSSGPPPIAYDPYTMNHTQY